MKENYPIKLFPIAACILMILAFAATFTPLFIGVNGENGNRKIFDLILAANLFLLISGTLLFAFYLFKQWIILVNHANEFKEKQTENERQDTYQKKLNNEAEARRTFTFERERNPINDLFRLIEFAKEELEVESDKSLKKIKGTDPTTTETNILTKKNKSVNTEILDKLIKHYIRLSAEQPTSPDHE